MTKLNRLDTARKSAEEYQKQSPDKGLQGIEYTKIAKEYLDGSTNKVHQKALIHAAVMSKLVSMDDLDDELKPEIQAVLDA